MQPEYEYSLLKKQKTYKQCSLLVNHPRKEPGILQQFELRVKVKHVYKLFSPARQWCMKTTPQHWQKQNSPEWLEQLLDRLSSIPPIADVAVKVTLGKYHIGINH